jgi:hypothetical protein
MGDRYRSDRPGGARAAPSRPARARAGLADVRLGCHGRPARQSFISNPASKGSRSCSPMRAFASRSGCSGSCSPREVATNAPAGSPKLPSISRARPRATANTADSPFGNHLLTESRMVEQAWPTPREDRGEAPAREGGPGARHQSGTRGKDQWTSIPIGSTRRCSRCSGSACKGACRAWKTFDWGAMDRLHAKGFISNPASRAKSVVLTDAGLRQSERLFR